jgi:hypothetical protein
MQVELTKHELILIRRALLQTGQATAKRAEEAERNPKLRDLSRKSSDDMRDLWKRFLAIDKAGLI